MKNKQTYQKMLGVAQEIIPRLYEDGYKTDFYKAKWDEFKDLNSGLVFDDSFVRAISSFGILPWIQVIKDDERYLRYLKNHYLSAVKILEGRIEESK